MDSLLETAHHVGGPLPVNIAIGVIVFLILVGAMALLHGFGASRPHS
jgi:3-polyprenyl-4-hydroxybenzoate decarboxylase